MELSPQAILRMHGGYYVVTGLAPLVSMRAFEAVTGKKTDRWLVRMVGLLAASIGAALLAAAENHEIETSALLLAAASGLSFAAIDIAYVARRRISPVYLGDAAVELALLGTLARSLLT
jgi:drug/metabolite transporter (DMT)-like permease